MKSKQEISHQVAKYLLEIEAIKINLEHPFQWASGWNSPIYCDNRMALSYPQIRDYIKEALSSAIIQNFKNAEAIAGVATAGIPQGSLVSDHLSLPFIYVRAKPKGHGLANQIEGKITEGQKVVVIEDLVSTGGSSIKAVEALRAAGISVLGMISIFTYGFKASYENMRNADIPYISLSDYEALIDVGLNANYINQEDVERLKAWRIDPALWK